MKPVDFLNYLGETERSVDLRLDRFFKIWQKEAGHTHSVLGDLLDRFFKLNYGGKRLRGLLVKLGYELAGGQDGKSIITAAAAYELLHTFLLVHDDIIDRADLRRGKVTLHLQYENLHKKLKLSNNQKDYGTAMAMIAGDIGNFLFLKLFMESDFEANLKVKALDYLAVVLTKTGFGEALDIDIGLHRSKDEGDVYLIHNLKTAQYTLVGPLVTGAILAGTNQRLITELTDFGQPLGLAFQIRDDVLGIYGIDEKTGKSAKSDIAEGKNTLLISYALKHAGKSDLAKLKKIYGHSPVSDQDLATIQKIFEDCGALNYSNDQSTKLLQKSLAVLDKIPADKKYKKILEQMAHFLVLREK